MSTLHPNLQARYLLDGNALDTSGAGLDGTNTNVAFAPGLGASVGVFDGTAFVDAGNVLDMGLSDMTWAAWIKTAEDDGVILSKARAASISGRWGMMLDPANGGALKVFCNFDSVSTVLYEGNAALGTNTYRHVAVTLDRTGYLRIYADGVLDAFHDISDKSAVDVQNNVPFRIGVYTASDNVGVFDSAGYRPFNGQIARVHIIDAALTQADIMRLVRGQLPARVYL